jgi:MFS family permease
MINGSYWVGSMAGSAAAIVFLSSFAADVGWRLCFGVGAVLGVAIMLVRRSVPESPRWLFIHGREDEAEEIVSRIERDVAAQTGQELEEPDETIEVRQREVIPFREIAQVAFSKYPRRAILGLALFVGQAFLYNAITFDLGTILNGFFKVASGAVPFFVLLFAAGNLLGPLTLGRLFDTVGRKPMISLSYLGSAAMAVVLGILLLGGTLDKWSFIALVGATFFLASAGASAAYLTVSEIFPMETRALAIAFFYAVGTAIGGITGPLLFGNLISSGKISEIATGFFIGAAVMAVGGVAEIFLGVRSERRALEDIATPLTAEDGEQEPADNDRRRQPRPQTRRERLRPGPGRSSVGWPGMPLPAASHTWSSHEREVDQIVRTLRERGPTGRGELGRALGARSWGPGRFGESLRAAQQQGQARRIARARYEATAHDSAGPRPERSAGPDGARRSPEQSRPPAPGGETLADGAGRTRPRSKSRQ